MLWTRDAATFQGKHYRVDQAVCLPRPAPPPALMIGGAGERRTLRVVARHAEWWNCDYYSPEEYAWKLGVLHGHFRAIGRDPAAVVPTCYMGVTVAYDPQRLVRRRFTGPRGEGAWSVARPTRSPASWEAFSAAGVRRMPLNFLDYLRTDSFDLFVDRVLPRFGTAAT